MSNNYLENLLGDSPRRFEFELPEPPKFELPELPKFELPEPIKLPDLAPMRDTPGLTDYGKAEMDRIQQNQPPGLTEYGRQEMHRMQMNLPPGLTPYAMGLPGIRPL